MILAAVGLSLSFGVLGAQSSAGGKAPAIEWHFLGERNFENVTNLTTFREIWNMPESQAWRGVAFEVFANRAATHFSHGKTNQELAKAIRPLLDDLANIESRFQLRGSGTNDASWMLALRLPAEREKLWSSNLWSLASATELGQPKISGGGWSARNSERNYSLAFTKKGPWTVITGGYGSTEKEQPLLKSLTDRSPNPRDYILKTRFDLAALKDELGLRHSSNLPEVSLNVGPRGAGLRSEMSLKFPEDLQIKPEKWNLPEKLIRDPLVAFTVVQGIERQLRKWDLLKTLQPEHVPNQLFFWSRNIIQFSDYFAADVGNPGPVMDRLTQTWSTNLNQKFQQMAIGNLEYHTNQHSLAWRGLPIVLPYLRPAPAPDSKFLVGGFFPTDDPKTNPPPAELLAQLNKKNLIYYDWEITAERLHHWRPLWQLTRILRNHVLPENSVSEKWLLAVASKIGNTITEGTLENSREVKIVRQSPVGLNALELVMLAHVVDPDIARRQPVARPPSSTPQSRSSTPPPLGRTPVRPKSSGPPAQPAKPAPQPK